MNPTMNDPQRERMQRNREAALQRLHSRELQSNVCQRADQVEASHSTLELRQQRKLLQPSIQGDFAQSTIPSSYKTREAMLQRFVSRNLEKVPVYTKNKMVIEETSPSHPQEHLLHMPITPSMAGNQLVHKNHGVSNTEPRQNNECSVPCLLSFTEVLHDAGSNLISQAAINESAIHHRPYRTSELRGDHCTLQSSVAINESRNLERDIDVVSNVRVPVDPVSIWLSEMSEIETKHIQPTLASLLGFFKAPQDFDYLVVIDFESTCDNLMALNPQEIIEFPAVLVNLQTQRLQAVFRTYVKPVHHPQLTEFCKRLTGIQQNQVDEGVSLGKALDLHDAWLEENGVKNKQFVVATWSDWDCKVMVESECKWKCLRKPAYFNRWINLKVPFRKKYGEIKTNLKGSVELMGCKWEGRQHSGLDDAKNTAHLALELVKQGVRLQVTNSFKTYAPDGSKITRPLLKRPKSMVNSEEMIAQGDLDEAKLYCYCGVKSHKRLVKKPGPSHGRRFFSCGKWTITTGGKCEFFVWSPQPPPTAPDHFQAS